MHMSQPSCVLKCLINFILIFTFGVVKNKKVEYRLTFLGIEPKPFRVGRTSTLLSFKMAGRLIDNVSLGFYIQLQND